MMACGGAVVVGRVSGYDEYIRDGVNALVVDAERPDEATAAVHRLLGDPALRASLVQAGMETAREWRWEPSIDVLERYYIDVVEGRRGVVMSRAAEQRSFSVAYFYGLLRGEVWQEPLDASDSDAGELETPDPGSLQSAALFSAKATASLAGDPTEKLIERLRQDRWFRAFASLVYRVYQAGKRVRARYRAGAAAP
jgi:hypothetical protein